MQKTVWLNKSNGQLCVTVPKNSGIKEGDIVNVEKEKIKTIVYSPITADLFHYGHLRILQQANELGDFHICGVLTNDAIKSYRGEPVADFKERMAIVSALQCVDMVMAQHTFEPIENLRQIREQFPNAKIIVVYGSNWKKAPGQEQIKKLGVQIMHYDFYEKLSSGKILQKLFNNKERGEAT